MTNMGVRLSLWASWLTQQMGRRRPRWHLARQQGGHAEGGAHQLPACAPALHHIPAPVRGPCTSNRPACQCLHAPVSFRTSILRISGHGNGQRADAPSLILCWSGQEAILL